MPDIDDTVNTLRNRPVKIMTTSIADIAHEVSGRILREAVEEGPDSLNVHHKISDPIVTAAFRMLFEDIATEIDQAWREKGGLNCTEVCAIVRARGVR